MGLFADHALAQRIESAEAQGGREWARACARLFAEAGIAWEEVAGGCAVFGGVGSPTTQVQGMGVAQPVTEDDLDGLEDFYRRRGSPTRILACPHAERSLFELTAKRGYRLAEMENVLARPLPSEAVDETPAAQLTVRRAEPFEAGVWARTVATGFLEVQAALFPDRVAEVDPKFLEMFLAAFETQDNHCFMTMADGVPAGGGSVSIYDGVALMNGASTVSRFRHRGGHRALYHARLALAAAAGCDLARVVTQPGSTSQRNAERGGFSVVYTRAALLRA